MVETNGEGCHGAFAVQDTRPKKGNRKTMCVFNYGYPIITHNIINLMY